MMMEISPDDGMLHPPLLRHTIPPSSISHPSSSILHPTIHHPSIIINPALRLLHFHTRVVTLTSDLCITASLRCRGNGRPMSGSTCRSGWRSGGRSLWGVLAPSVRQAWRCRGNRPP